MTSLAPERGLGLDVRRPRQVALERTIAACLAIAVTFHVGLSARGVLLGAFTAVLVKLAAIDLERRIIPNRIVLPAVLAVLIGWLAIDPGRFVESLLAGLGAGAFVLLPSLVQRGAVGMGDVKLALLLGAGLGGAVVPGLVLGLCATGAFALVLVVSRGRSALKQEIPLGPFLAAGAIGAILLSSAGALS
jgi:prepilin signal peptidase PulO-like enzyme (type II secretory pathway)